MNHKEICSTGGKSTLKKYGKEHFSEMGKKGANTLKEKYGKDYYSKISKGIKLKKESDVNSTT